MAALRTCRILSLEDCLYSIRVVRLALVHGVSEHFQPPCGIVFGLWGNEISLSLSLSLYLSLYIYIYLSLAATNTRVPLFLSAMDPLWLQPDRATHQGVVCVASRTVVRACV